MTKVRWNQYAFLTAIEHFSYFAGSKCHTRAMYKETAQLIEKLCRIGYFVMARVTPISWIFPKALFNYVIYFFTDVGSEVFELPLMTW